MEMTTLAGLVFALIGLLGGMIFKHVPLSNLANPAAIFIILIGTVGAVLNATPGKDIKNVGKLFKIIFAGNKTPYTNEETINLLTDLSQLARKEGLLVLEKKAAEVKDPFLVRGLNMTITGETGEAIFDTLAQEIEAMESRHQANAQIFSQAGAYAPTLGVLGAVIGLIAALGNMEDQHALGVAISAAFMATVYGIFTGYVLWHPFANKLKRKSKIEALNKRIILEGILLIQAGTSPNMLKDKLFAFISEKERGSFPQQSGDGSSA